MIPHGYYLVENVGEAECRRDATDRAERHRETSVLHRHAYGEPCDRRRCEMIEPVPPPPPPATVVIADGKGWDDAVPRTTVP